MRLWVELPLRLAVSGVEMWRGNLGRSCLVGVLLLPLVVGMALLMGRCSVWKLASRRLLRWQGLGVLWDSGGANRLVSLCTLVLVWVYICCEWDAFLAGVYHLSSRLHGL